MIFENLTKRFKKRSASMVGLTLSSPGVICPSGYTRLSDAPEVAAAVWRISDMIASMTIHLMENAKNGDVRVKDELARKVDVAPWSLGTRQTLIGWIVSTLLTEGNAFVLPVTRDGLLTDLWPMPTAYAQRRPDGSPYEIVWQGMAFGCCTSVCAPMRAIPGRAWGRACSSATLWTASPRRRRRRRRT